MQVRSFGRFCGGVSGKRTEKENFVGEGCAAAEKPQTGKRGGRKGFQTFKRKEEFSSDDTERTEGKKRGREKWLRAGFRGSGRESR